MSLFGTYIMVDWSAASVPSKPNAPDSIWIGMAQAGAAAEVFHVPTRAAAEDIISELISDRPGRVLIGFDFAFGYPEGFAKAVTGRADTLGLWEWLGGRIEDDARNRNNRFAVADSVNAMFEGDGPFWGKLGKGSEALVNLSDKKRSAVAGLAQNRAVELVAHGNPKSVWQLCYAGAVGSQSLMGLPMLSRLRHRFRDDLRVWPFEQSADAEVVLAEIYPSLLADAVAMAAHEVKDARQVAVMAEAFARLGAEELNQLFAAGAHSREEGWILGVGAEHVLRSAA